MTDNCCHSEDVGFRPSPIRRQRFTLIELIVAISLSSIVIGVMMGIYDSGMNAYQMTSSRTMAHRLARQTLDSMIDGSDFYPGLREAVVVKSASPRQVTFVPYYTDYIPFSGGMKRGKRIELSRPYLVGSPNPLAEVQRGNGSIELVRALVEIDPKGKTAIVLDEAVVGSGTLTVLYFPDAKADANMYMTFAWDPSAQSLERTYLGKTDLLPVRIMDSFITDFSFSYTDASGTELDFSKKTTARKQTGHGVTAVQVNIQTTAGNEVLEMEGLVNLRNLRPLGGVVSISEGSRFSLPPSDGIAEFSLVNFEGAQIGDRAEFKISQKGKSYLIKLSFGLSVGGKDQDDKIRVQGLSIEYPAGSVVHTRTLNRSLREGINMLDIGNPNVDYDEDKPSDRVRFTGEDIWFSVERMDFSGAGLIVQ